MELCEQILQYDFISTGCNTGNVSRAFVVIKKVFESELLGLRVSTIY